MVSKLSIYFCDVKKRCESIHIFCMSNWRATSHIEFMCVFSVLGKQILGISRHVPSIPLYLGTYHWCKPVKNASMDPNVISRNYFANLQLQNLHVNVLLKRLSRKSKSMQKQIFHLGMFPIIFVCIMWHVNLTCFVVTYSLILDWKTNRACLPSDNFNNLI